MILALALTWKGLVRLLKADLHIHTEYSMDCDMSLEKIINRCAEIGINCIAIADHGTIEGAVEMRKLAPFPVIIAEEILTPYGEIMGMFLEEGIPSGLSAEETISRIRDQGGLICIPHPFDALRQSALNSGEVETMAEQIDIVEVFNARTLLLRYSTQALTFARKYGIPGSAGSDAHIPAEIGNAYVEMSEFNGKDDFIQALTAGKISGHKTNPLIHFGTAWARLKKRF